MAKSAYVALLVALLVATGAHCLDVQTGRITPFQWNTQNPFETSTTSNLEETYEFKFDEPFSSIPKVLLTVELIDMGTQVPNGWEILVDTVTKEGFTYKVTRYGNQYMYTLSLRWFATVDSNVQFYYYSLFEEDFDNRQAKIFWPEGEYGLPYPDVRATAFLTGVGWNPKQSKEFIDINLQLTQVDQWGCNLEAGSSVSQGENYVGDWIAFVIVAANSQNFVASGVTYDVTGNSDPWVSGSGSGRNKVLSVSTDEAEFFEPQRRFAVQGLSGYAFKNGPNARINVGNYEFSDDGADYSLTLGTWADTVIRSASTGIFFYNHVPDCATIYSECNFEGDSLEVCSGEPVSDFEVTQWGKKAVRSVQVPFKRTLTLFDNSGLQGPSVQVSESVECVEGEWTFNQ